MTIGEWLEQAEDKLKQAGIGSANLDALILLEDELKKDRAWLLAHPEIPLQGVTLQRFLQRLEAKLARRLKHEPLAYIRGFSEFYGRRFAIDKRVLEPRPESETMIELLKEIVASQQSPVASNPSYKARPYSKDSPCGVVDVGTGSGALAVTAKLEIPESEVYATEVDKGALQVAKANAKKLKADIQFFHGDLLKPLPSKLLASNSELLILANLPYVPDKWQINEAAAMEPRVAIFGGPDGLDLYRRMFAQIDELAPEKFSKKALRVKKPKLVFTEALPPQHEELAKIARSSGYSLKTTRDFIQVFAID